MLIKFTNFRGQLQNGPLQAPLAMHPMLFFRHSNVRFSGLLARQSQKRLPQKAASIMLLQQNVPCFTNWKVSEPLPASVFFSQKHAMVAAGHYNQSFCNAQMHEQPQNLDAEIGTSMQSSDARLFPPVKVAHYQLVQLRRR